MQLKLFKTLWGVDEPIDVACKQAVAAGFDGIEGPAPDATHQAYFFKQQLADAGLAYIAEITTAGSYVPERRASVQVHIESFCRKLEQSLQLDPLFVTSLAGCDAWPEGQSIELFGRLMEAAQKAGITVSFETHRSRSLFNPWTTLRICQQLPDLKLTLDFSHWCVVCERLMDSEIDVLEALAPQAFHIHARVGYDQGPQVPDPGNPRYQKELESHLAWWHLLWESIRERGGSHLTMTPEFGPDGYQQLDVKTNQPIGDLWQYNQWMGQQLRNKFKHFI